MFGRLFLLSGVVGVRSRSCQLIFSNMFKGLCSTSLNHPWNWIFLVEEKNPTMIHQLLIQFADLIVFSACFGTENFYLKKINNFFG